MDAILRVTLSFTLRLDVQQKDHSQKTKGAWAAETFKVSLGQSILEFFRSKTEKTRIIVMGSHDSGKTTILKRIRKSKQLHASLITTVPTLLD